MIQIELKPDYLLNGRYRICGSLGQGGFGITYRATDETTGQTVAVKEYFPRTIVLREDDGTVFPPQDDPDKTRYDEGLNRFLQEARTLASLFEVPGVVKVLNFFRANQTAYIVMEYVRGISLRRWLERQEQGFSFDETCQMFRPVIDALESIHKKNLIHRDITPDNLMVDEIGNLKLLDFGSAREYFTKQDREQTMTVLVKYAYAPPEQYERHGKQGPWTDIYSLCATMYETMTGCSPQNAKEREVKDKLYPVSSFDVEITPLQEEAFMKKGLALNVRERYPSIRRMKEDFFAKEQPEPHPGSRRKIRTFIVLPVLLVLLLLSVLIWKTVCFLTEPAEEPSELAGDYVRGSEEYTEFLDFVRQHAISTETKDDVTTYTLDEEAVREWGHSSNTPSIGYTRDEFVKDVRELGYAPEADTTTDDFTVQEKPYGVIVTRFDRVEVCPLSGDISLLLSYDLFSQEITRIVVSAPLEEKEEAVPCFVDIYSLLSTDWQGSRDDHIRELSDYADSWAQDPDNSDVYLPGEEIRAYFLWVDEDETRFGLMFRSNNAPVAKYYWP